MVIGGISFQLVQMTVEGPRVCIGVYEHNVGKRL
jgi:hypothetical protein